MNATDASGPEPPRSAPAPACARCGVPGGQHVNAIACIDVLRDRIVRLEFRQESLAHPAQPEHRGGRRNRADNRMVVLDGDRLTLTDAARRLGITASTLHFRILNRTGNSAYRDVDVRTVGADGARQRRTAAIREPANAI